MPTISSRDNTVHRIREELFDDGRVSKFFTRLNNPYTVDGLNPHFGPARACARKGGSAANIEENNKWLRGDRGTTDRREGL